MIKFFRNIRKKLLAEGKTANYLKYAIGEIVLVVIGILIALQINNWNGERKERILEVKVLKEISSDLQNDILSLENDVYLNQNLISSVNIIKKALVSNMEYHDSLAFHFGRLNFNTTFTMKMSGFDNLNNLGFQIIEKDSIRKAITDLYESDYSFLKETEVTNDQATYEYFGTRYLPYFKELKSLPKRQAVKLYTPKDFNSMKTSSDFWFLLDYIVLVKENNLFNLNETIEHIKNTEKLIDNYLKTISN